MKCAEPIQPNNKSSPIGDNTNLFQDSEDGGSQERLIWMKTEKAKRRLTKEKDPMWQEMLSSVEKSQELMQKQHKGYLRSQKREMRAIYW